MQKIKQYLWIVAAIVLLYSCGGTSSKLFSGHLSQGERYKIKSYTGCCGCHAEYFEIYESSKVKEQVIYKYNCHTPGMPTKFVFSYSEGGEILYCDKYVATTDNDFEQRLTDNERALFELLENNNKTLILKNNSVRYSSIVGFRKAKKDEVTHTFPLDKNGYSVEVR
jgi:hypothetical protein